MWEAQLGSPHCCLSSAPTDIPQQLQGWVLTAVMLPSKECHSWGTQKSQGSAHNYPGTDWEMSNDV